MRFSTIVAAACGIASVSAHGVVTSIQGANGVSMNGLSVIAGTPRDCASPRCGSEADTSIIRQREIASGKASPLGRTQGGGAVDAAAAVSDFLGKSANAKRAQNGFAGFGRKKGKGNKAGKGKGLAAGLGLGAAAGAADAATSDAVGTKTAKGTQQEGQTGAGTQGLPSVGEDGIVTMTYHQVNQDGAGPLTAEVDPTSGGTDNAAFVAAEMVADVPGKILGLSATTTTDFAISAKIPAGTVCSGTVAGVSGVCVMRLSNGALAGPFGGSVAFVQSAAAKKRAVEFNEIAKRAALPPAEIQDDEDVETETAEDDE